MRHSTPQNTPPRAPPPIRFRKNRQTRASGSSGRGPPSAVRAPTILCLCPPRLKVLRRRSRSRMRQPAPPPMTLWAVTSLPSAAAGQPRRLRTITLNRSCMRVSGCSARVLRHRTLPPPRRWIPQRIFPQTRQLLRFLPSTMMSRSSRRKHPQSRMLKVPRLRMRMRCLRR